jgi:hypothetical protein
MAAAPLADKAAMLASLANYLIFFLPGFVMDWRTQQRDAVRLAKFRTTVEDSVHRCRTCDRTEISHPELDFRVASDGEEYCAEHLPKRV